MSDERTLWQWVGELGRELHRLGYWVTDAREAATLTNETFREGLTSAVRGALDDARRWRTRADAAKCRDAACAYLLTVVSDENAPRDERMHAATLLLGVRGE